MSMVVTIYDVAKLAGVSIATVSRVINKTGNVTPKTVARVKEAMEQLNFSPNSLAQNFAKMKSRTIGLIIPISSNNKLSNDYMDSFYSTEIFRGVNNVLLAEEYSMLLINTKNDFENIVHEFVDQKKIEGLIIGANPSHLVGFKEAILQKKPIVYIGQVEEFNQGLHVYAQYTQYINKTLNYLVEKGHKNIAYFGLVENKELSTELRQDKKGIKINCYSISSTIEDMQEKIRNLFCSKDRPTALFFESFEGIQPVLSTLNEINLKVPEDVSIISVEHKKGLGASYVPQITNVYVPAYEMGKVAARALIDYLNGNIEEYNQQFNLESNIIERSSVGILDR
jgi:LacI family transcriptional regulator